MEKFVQFMNFRCDESILTGESLSVIKDRVHPDENPSIQEEQTVASGLAINYLLRR